MDNTDNIFLNKVTLMMNYLRKGGVLTPFLNVIVISLFPISLCSIAGIKAYGQPILFWGLILFCLESIITFTLGIIIVCKNPELLMTEEHQEKMRGMEIDEKGIPLEQISQDQEESDSNIDEERR